MARKPLVLDPPDDTSPQDPVALVQDGDVTTAPPDPAEDMIEAGEAEQANRSDLPSPDEDPEFDVTDVAVVLRTGKLVTVPGAEARRMMASHEALRLATPQDVRIGG